MQPNMGGESGAMTQDYKISNLMIENNDLKRRIYILEQEKFNLS